MRWAGLRNLIVAGIVTAATSAGAFDYRRQLFDPPATLGLNPPSIDPDTGLVIANGGESGHVIEPFTWDWGDGSPPVGSWFPAQHTYTDTTRNYVITVTAQYAGGETDSLQILARFAAPQISPVALPSETAVTIATEDVALGSRMGGYVPPITMIPFEDSHFGTVPRSTIEYVLSAAAPIQMDLANGDVEEVDGGFQQVLLRDIRLSGGAMLSVWFTTPVSFSASPDAMQGSIPWSSFLHEMGHNVTLNFPADYRYGGRIDGSAYAIYTETMAQIFQHATAYEMVNNAEAYGLGEDLALDIATSAASTIGVLRSAYERYIGNGAPFHTWNDPATPEDETSDTFMTVAYKFCEHAENAGQGYATPLKRMMSLLALFDEDMEARYDRAADSVQADAFRATLMVAALSHAFLTDLRAEFEALNFAIEDDTYEALIAAALATATPGDANVDGLVGDNDLSLLLSNWGRDVAWTGGNFNGDDVVNDNDLSLLLANWTGAVEGRGVPDPATLGLLAVGGGVLVRRRR